VYSKIILLDEYLIAAAEKVHIGYTITAVFSERPSVCRLSVVCLSVTFVCPTQTIEIFGNVSTPFDSLAIC